jgi:hypothetical protein
MTAPLDPIAIRSVLSQLPNVAAQESLEPPPLKHIYVPMGHHKALSLDASIVVGMRGAGKSLWTAVLSSPDHRAFVASLIQSPALQHVDVRVGFGLDDSNEHFPSEAVLGKLTAEGHAPLSIWQAVVLRHAHQVLGKPLPFPKDWRGAVTWIASNTEQVGSRFRACDDDLRTASKSLLVAFDALDRLAGTWDGVRNLMVGALQLGLQCRSWRAIRLKFFLRPDMEEDEVVWLLRDSSKLRHARVELSWQTADLYSLVLMYLANHVEQGPAFRKYVEHVMKDEWTARDGVFSPPRALVADDERLRRVIESITGEWMGKSKKRGFTYTWIPTHLADAVNRVSPRSFLLAFKHAAEVTHDRYPGHGTALHYEAIQQGVTAASQIRVGEIKEDYPWVEPLLEAARGLTVPCRPEELTSRWTPQRIQAVQQATDKLPPRRFSTDPYRRETADALIDDLVDLAVLYRTSDARLNMPDIFRVGFGIKRKGGVKPPMGIKRSTRP